MKKKYIIFIAFICLAIALTALSIFNSRNFQPKKGIAGGFGISPPYFKNSHLEPGETATGTITVLRSESGASERIGVATNTPEFPSWISFIPKEIIIPAGEFNASVQVIAKVPLKAKPGKYQGFIIFYNLPDKGAGPGVGINLAARANVNLTVVPKTNLKK